MVGGALLPPSKSNDFNLKSELIKLSHEERIKNSSNKSFDVLEHWEVRRSSHSQIYKISQVVLSFPATQVSVERAFSALAFILSHWRSMMGSETINNLMLVMQNIDLLDQVNFV